jgi:hypothetical protein
MNASLRSEVKQFNKNICCREFPSIHGGPMELVQDHHKVIVEFEIVAFDQTRLLKNSPTLAVGLRLLHFFIQVLQIEVFLNRQRPRLFAQGPKNRDEVHGCCSSQLVMR